MTRRELPIDEGVVLPVAKRQARTVGGETARKMNVNDSVFTTASTEADSIRRAIYALGGKAAFRKRIENGVLGFRIWRTK